MTGVEQLIRDQEKMIESLQAEVANLHGHVRDFERLAKTWMKSYEELAAKYKRDIGNAHQTITELELELADFRRQEP